MKRISSRPYSMPGCCSARCCWVSSTSSSSPAAWMVVPHGQVSLVFMAVSVGRLSRPAEGYRTPMTDPAPASETPATPRDPLRSSRTSGAWLAVVALAVLLLLLVVFIAQNTQDVEVSFLGWDGEAPLAVSLLVAAVVGIALTAVAGTLRIWQLRRRVRRTRP